MTTKLVFVKKPHKLKSRLVVRGHTAIKGVHYKETFSGTARATNIRTVLAIAANKGMQLATLDIQNAYLHSKLDHTVHLELPKHMFPPELKEKYKTREEASKDYVLRLCKACYGMPQSGRLFQRTLAAALVKLEFRKLSTDVCVFTKTIPLSTTGEKGYTILAHYVDDCLLAYTPDASVRAVVAQDVHSLDTSFGVTRPIFGSH
jgi:hypothetical protein